MEIGILKETYIGETRVPLIPFAVGELIKQGNQVFIQSEAGLASGFEEKEHRTKIKEVMSYEIMS